MRYRKKLSQDKADVLARTRQAAANVTPKKGLDQGGASTILADNQGETAE